MPERLNGHDWKSCDGGKLVRGFESLPLRCRACQAGGGCELPSGAGCGRSPLSSNTPSVSSSTTSTTWRADTARYSWRSGGRLPSSQRQLDVGEREELALVGVEEVGRPGAEALVGELQRPLDLVARVSIRIALAAEVHVVSIGQRAGPL